MEHYLVKGATTKSGPVNFPVCVPSHCSLDVVTGAVNEEAKRRGIVVCHDWNHFDISAADYERLELIAAAQGMLDALKPLTPMNSSNGFLDSVVWPILRREQEHRHAETLTSIQNDVRAAQRRLMDALGIDK